MQHSPSPSQARSVAIGTALLALLPVWEVWSVLSSGSMVGIQCDGLFSGTLCAAGRTVGTLLFGPQRDHLGYALVSASLALLMLFGAWRVLASAKRQTK